MVDFSFSSVKTRWKHWNTQRLQLRHEIECGVVQLVTRCSRSFDTQLLSRRIELTIPSAPNRVSSDASMDVAWFSVGQWLLIGERDTLNRYARKIRTILSGDTALVVDLRHQMDVFQLSGPASTDVLSSHMSIDVARWADRESICMTTMCGEVTVFLQRLDGESRYRLIVDQSYADYLVGLLTGEV